MKDSKTVVGRFLELQHIAIAGVSRKGNLPGNSICQKFKECGRDVYIVHPEINEWEGITCYPSVESLPGKIEGLVIATHSKHALELTKQAVAKQIRHIWYHRSFDAGSAGDEGPYFAAEHGVSTITDGCPMMVLEPVDIVHRCMKWFKGFPPRID